MSQQEVFELMKQINDRFDALEEKLDKRYVSKDTFAPVQKIVYGGVGLLLTVVGAAVLALVVK